MLWPAASSLLFWHNHCMTELRPRRALWSAVLAAFACALAFGQVTESLTFEVASVKPAPVPQGARVFFGPPRGGPGTPDPGRITWSYATLKNMLMTAYDVKAYQVSGPAWLGSERYDIAARSRQARPKNRSK
jgi:hypothetical protein